MIGIVILIDGYVLISVYLCIAFIAVCPSLLYRYGLSALSFPRLLDRINLGPKGKWGLTECGMISHLYIDSVHPSKLGMLLTADLMVRSLSLIVSDLIFF